MKLAWIVAASTAAGVVVAVLGMVIVALWPVLDPWACAKAERELDAHLGVASSLPRELAADVEQTNGCDSGDGGWTTLTPDAGLKVADVDRLLKHEGWTTQDEGWTTGDDRAPAEYRKVINRQEWDLSVYSERGDLVLGLD